MKLFNQCTNIELVAKRFIHLFNDHGVETSQIPRFFPKISYQDISSTSSLIKALDPNILEEVAQLFKIRAQWLEGVDNLIYQRSFCYKRPQLFFQALENLEISDDDYLLRVITPCECLDFKETLNQPLMFAVLERVGELNDEFIYRYQLWDCFDWSEADCRIQLKAIALSLFEVHQFPIPIYKINHKDFQKIADGKKIPFDAFDGCVITDPSLEDYILDQSQSGKAKEVEELAIVKDYVKEYKLDNLVKKLKFKLLSDSIKEFKVSVESSKGNQQSIQKQGGLARHSLTNELKRECIRFWLGLNKTTSYANAARKFIGECGEDKLRPLAPSNREKFFTEAISVYERRLTLESDEFPNWLVGFNPKD